MAGIIREDFSKREKEKKNLNILSPPRKMVITAFHLHGGGKVHYVSLLENCTVGITE